MKGCSEHRSVDVFVCQLLTLSILVSFRSTEDDHDVPSVTISVILSASLVLVWEVPSCYLFIDEHSSIGDAIFDKVGHPKP